MVTIQVLLICCVPIQKPHMVGVMEVTSLHCPAKSGEISKSLCNLRAVLQYQYWYPHPRYPSPCHLYLYLYPSQELYLSLFLPLLKRPLFQAHTLWLPTSESAHITHPISITQPILFTSVHNLIEQVYHWSWSSFGLCRWISIKSLDLNPHTVIICILLSRHDNICASQWVHKDTSWRHRMLIFYLPQHFISGQWLLRMLLPFLRIHNHLSPMWFPPSLILRRNL